MADMTYEEFDQIPEMCDRKALYQPNAHDPAVVIDRNGVRWLIGYADGVLCKRRME
jgi:hypothetical protein